jgi:hypothetical protein
MNEQERAYFIAFAKEYQKKIEGDPKLARQLLIDIGMYTEDGELSEHLKHYATRQRPIAETV